jgi:hypothetical protein
MIYKLKNGSTVRIHRDDNPMNPQVEFDNLWTLVGWHRCYEVGASAKVKRDGLYWDGIARTLGVYSRAFDSPKDFEAELNSRNDLIALPVYMYDHGGCTFSLSPFSCPWDSGQIGYMVSHKQFLAGEYGRPAKRWTGKFKEWALRMAAIGLKVYDDYQSGNAWGYVRTDANGEREDSCWGFFGSYEHGENGLWDAAGITEDQILERIENG